MKKIDGIIVCYNIRTGAGLLKDDEGREYFFEYSGVDAPLIRETRRARLRQNIRTGQDTIEVLSGGDRSLGARGE